MKRTHGYPILSRYTLEWLTLAQRGSSRDNKAHRIKYIPEYNIILYIALVNNMIMAAGKTKNLELNETQLKTEKGFSMEFRHGKYDW